MASGSAEPLRPTADTSHWKFFPCAAGSKVPALEGDWRKHSTSDPATIKRWLAAGYNLALDCGASEVTVLDPDADKATGERIGDAELSALERENTALPETYTVHTPNGGKHYYFEDPEGVGLRDLASHVNVRSAGGYVLVHPSVVDGKPYAIVSDLALAPLPRWVRSAVAARATAKAVAASGVELDAPDAISRAKVMLEGVTPAVEGAGGDNHTYAVINKVLDVAALSPLTCLDVLSGWNDRCDPPWDEDALLIKIENALSYRQNDLGAWSTPPAAERFGDALAQLTTAPQPEPEGAKDGRPRHIDEDAWARARAKLGFHTHVEGRNRPPRLYWPNTFLPRVRDEGVLGTILAQSGGGKTTMIGVQCMEVIKAGGRVIYFPGEGLHGLDTQRIPQWQAEAGVSDEDMLASWRTANAIPNLSNSAEMEFAVWAHARWMRETGGLAIFDTLKSATPGVDENSSAIGDFLAGDGALRFFCNQARCTGLVAHHIGKEAAREERGHSSIAGNSDFIQIVNWRKDSAAIELVHRKDRDGRDGFSTHYQAVTTSSGVPVARRISAAQFHALRPPAGAGRRKEVEEALDALFIGNPNQEPITTEALAAQIATMRETRRMADLEALGDDPMPLDAKQFQKKVDSVRINLLNKYARPQDGEKAELFDFVSKDEDGQMLPHDTRRWRPAIMRFAPVVGSMALKDSDGQGAE